MLQLQASCVAAAWIAKANAMAARYPSIGLGVAVLLLAGAGAAVADDDCYCINSTGGRVTVGDVACLKTNRGMREARCGMVLNNTSWIFTGKSCPLAWRGKTSEFAINLGR
jgi:hypothetical protein